VWKPQRQDAVKVATIADSTGSATGATLPNGGWEAIAGKLLGWSDVREIAIGGSGFVNTGPSNSTFGDATRLADLAEANPDVLVVMSSSNDSATATATVTAAALAALRAYRTALPSAPIIVTGAWGGAGPSAAQTNNENAVKSAFDTWADANSWWVPVLTDTTGSWVFGTGTSSATNGSGNTDYFAFDTAHPNQAGHFYFAARFARAVRDLVLPNVKAA
jgi:lysophospholipase L1-like esterase